MLYVLLTRLPRQIELKLQYLIVRLCICAKLITQSIVQHSRSHLRKKNIIIKVFSFRDARDTCPPITCFHSTEVLRLVETLLIYQELESRIMWGRCCFMFTFTAYSQLNFLVKRKKQQLQTAAGYAHTSWLVWDHDRRLRKRGSGKGSIIQTFNDIFFPAQKVLHPYLPKNTSYKNVDKLI